MSIVQFADHQMTDAEYRQRRDTIRATYGDTAIERTGRFDQELARLFHQSGWTLEQLATAEGKGKSWVDYRVRFGRFLNFSTTVEIPKNLTERRFRSYWERTSGTNERVRFTAVAKLMQEETVLSRSHLNKKAIGAAIKWMGEVFSMKTPEMKSQAIVAAMYASYDAHPVEARKFWESVARGGTEYEDSAPATVLDEWLKEIKENHKRDPLTPAQIYQGCVYAYNAYRKGQPLKSIKYDFKVYPEPIGLAA